MTTKKTVLVTGATDGIGLDAARRLVADGHRVMLHGRSQEKLDAAVAAVGGEAEGILADLSNLGEAEALARAVQAGFERVDTLVNNAGVLETPSPVTKTGLDVRFVVNTLAPYVLTRGLLDAMPSDGRVINVASAAQAPVDADALAGGMRLESMQAYSQSKLALIMWSRALAAELPAGPAVIAVNPGSLLATNMVREGFGVPGKDLGIGGDILYRLAVSEAFADASGRYFDNDAGDFGDPHADALNDAKCAELTEAIDALLGR